MEANHLAYIYDSPVLRLRVTWPILQFFYVYNPPMKLRSRHIFDLQSSWFFIAHFWTRSIPNYIPSDPTTRLFPICSNHTSTGFVNLPVGGVSLDTAHATQGVAECDTVHWVGTGLLLGEWRNHWFYAPLDDSTSGTSRLPVDWFWGLEYFRFSEGFDSTWPG